MSLVRSGATAASVLAAGSLIANQLNTVGRAFETGRSYYNMAKRAGSYLSRYGKRSRYARIPRARGPRRMYGRKPKRASRYRGRRYTQRGRKAFKRLNQNFSRNDYKTIRVMQNLGEIGVGEGIQATNTQRFSASVETAQGAGWGVEIAKYSEFKVSSLQFVIAPRTVRSSSQNIRVATNNIPKLAIRTVLPGEPLVPLTDVTKLRQTPGYRYVSLTKTTRTVINQPLTYSHIDTIHNAGSNIIFTKVKTLPWIGLDFNTAGYKFANLEVVRPTIDTLQGASIFWDVHVYFTLSMRGNIDELVDPTD